MADLQDLDVGKLRRMSHVELQSLAKKLQIRANMKTDKIRDAIMVKMVETEVESDADSSQVITADQDTPALTSDQVDVAIAVCSESLDKMADLRPDQDEEKRRALRRRTYEVTPEIALAAASKMADVIVPTEAMSMLNQPSGAESSMAVSPSPPAGATQENASSTESIYYAADCMTPIKVPSPIYLSAKANRKRNSLHKLTPRVKTPKLKGVDRSVGQTPERKVYNLRSTAANKPQKSLIPRPVKNDKKAKRIQKTPNTAKIPEKAFAKMESIDAIISRKQLLINNYKSLAFRGPRALRKTVPTEEPHNIFKPTVLTTKRINLNFASMKPRPKKTPSAAATTASLVDTTVVVSSRPVFNLKESLGKKLRYQPHSGPLKPLDNNSQPFGNIKVSGHKAKTIQDKYRTENASFLNIVRRNRRLDLQLKLRGVID